MRKFWIPFMVAGIAAFSLIACKKDVKTTDSQNDAISQGTLAKIQHLGFSTKSVQKVEEGYLVEGDIVLTDELLNSTPEYKLLRAGNEEQY